MSQKYSYKCGFCGAIKGEIKNPCPQHKCQKIQDEAREAAREELGHGFMEHESDGDKRQGFIHGYYFAKMKAR